MPMDQWALQLAGQLAVMAVTGLAGWLAGRLREARRTAREDREREVRERDESRSMMRLLYFYRLNDLFKQYVVAGDDISAAEKHEVEEVYHYYHDALGGNGEGTRMFNEIMALKTS